jgi:hypothetical protein
MWHDLQEVRDDLLICGPVGMSWDPILELNLRVGVVSLSRDRRFLGDTVIRCHRALDWGLRPQSPGWLLGGAQLVLYDAVRLDVLQGLGVRDINMTEIPGADGQVFDPPLQLRLLVLGRSWVVAERFEIAEVTGE